MNILEFQNPVPGWANYKAQIVARSSNEFVDFDIITEQTDSPGTGIAINAQGVDKVKSWLERGEAGWCLPGDLMGPDLMAQVRLENGDIILLVIQAKCHMFGNIETTTGEVTADAILLLIPSTWFQSTVCGSLLQ